MSSQRLLRIGDNLDDLSKINHHEKFINFEKLATRVFDPELADEKVDRFYINTPSEQLVTGDSFDSTHFAGLGAFERGLLSLFLKPEKRVYIITGQAGCGKSTSITYLVSRFDDITKSSKRSIYPIRLNLNESMYETNDEIIAKDLLYGELTSKILGILRMNGIPEKVELIDFWNWGLDNEQRNLSTQQTVFSDIASYLSQVKDLMTSDPEYQQLYSDRKNVLEHLKLSPNKYFNYILRLWGYSLQIQGEQQRSFIILDNIDKASSIVQFSLLSLLNDISSEPGPCVFVTMRPETFDYLHIKGFKKSKSIGTREHPGFNASMVIKDRIERFVNNPNLYYDSCDGLSINEFQNFHSFMETILSIYNSEKSSVHTDFLDAASGNNLRIALCLAQKYFKISVIEFNEGRISHHTLNRIVVVNEGNPQHRDHFRSLMQNLFVLQPDNPSKPLLKYRILCYLHSRPQYTDKLINISSEMVGFEYLATGEVKPGLSDLLSYSNNLLITDGLENYHSDDEFVHSSNNNISLSSKGQKYFDKIIFSLDYIQEIMLDCYLPLDWVTKRLPFSTLPEKFSLLLDFIDYLNIIDQMDTDYYIRYHFGRARYHTSYGHEFLTLTLLRNCCTSILSIYLAKKRGLTANEKEEFNNVFNKAITNLFNYNEKNLSLIGISSLEAKKILTDIQTYTEVMR